MQKQADYQSGGLKGEGSEQQGAAVDRDLEITRLCARAMNYSLEFWSVSLWFPADGNVHAKRYDPLHDDAQAMALLEHLRLCAEPYADIWFVRTSTGKHESAGGGLNGGLKRAIVECVAKLQASRTTTPSPGALSGCGQNSDNQPDFAVQKPAGGNDGR